MPSGVARISPKAKELTISTLQCGFSGGIYDAAFLHDFNPAIHAPPSSIVPSLVSVAIPRSAPIFCAETRDGDIASLAMWFLPRPIECNQPISRALSPVRKFPVSCSSSMCPQRHCNTLNTGYTGCVCDGPQSTEIAECGQPHGMRR